MLRFAVHALSPLRLAARVCAGSAMQLPAQSRDAGVMLSLQLLGAEALMLPGRAGCDQAQFCLPTPWLSWEQVALGSADFSISGYLRAAGGGFPSCSRHSSWRDAQVMWLGPWVPCGRGGRIHVIWALGL